MRYFKIVSGSWPSCYKKNVAYPENAVLRDGAMNMLQLSRVYPEQVIEIKEEMQEFKLTAEKIREMAGESPEVEKSLRKAFESFKVGDVIQVNNYKFLVFPVLSKKN